MTTLRVHDAAALLPGDRMLLNRPGTAPMMATVVKVESTNFHRTEVLWRFDDGRERLTAYRGLAQSGPFYPVHRP